MKKTLIVGAGFAGEALMHDISVQAQDGFDVIGFLDDDPKLHGKEVCGISILGAVDQLDHVIVSKQIEMVIIAIPSLQDVGLLNVVFDVCYQRGIQMMTLPSLHHIQNDHVSLRILRNVSIDDLLGRDPVDLHNRVLEKKIANKVVLVTGAGGSIGSELCHQIALNRPNRLLLLESHEYSLYRIEKALLEAYPEVNLMPVLMDVTDEAQLDRLMAVEKPNMIFHAAALKHVHMVERHPLSAFKTNALATQRLADLADAYAVDDFIYVSTDKAVAPSSIMGLTKRLGEIYCQNKNARSMTRYMTVRFGNVLGSSGSVLPLFQEQLEKGGPLTVTDSRMTRYFMTIPEAVSLILQAYLLGNGGEIFVLDMGKPVKILDLAERLISLSGKKPYDEIPIVFTSKQPGEKIHERLFDSFEELQVTANDKIFEAKSIQYHWKKIHDLFESLKLALDMGDHDDMITYAYDLLQSTALSLEGDSSVV